MRPQKSNVKNTSNARTRALPNEKGSRRPAGQVPEPVNLPDPQPVIADRFENGESKYGLTRFQNQSTYTGPLSRATIQGEISDCHFAAGVSALAAINEKAFLEVFQGCLSKTEKGYELKPDPQGRYTFRFFKEGNVNRPVNIKIDGDLFSYDGKELVYGSGPQINEQTNELSLIYPLLEKAYATWKGGYEVLAQGGSPAVVMAELMGGQPSTSSQ